MTLLLFLVSTLFTSLTMLNMLIAIMGDTFDHAMENKHVNCMQTKLQILGDQTAVMTSSLSKAEKQRIVREFMFMARPKDYVDVNDLVWCGSNQKMQNVVQKHVGRMQKDLAKRSDKLQATIS